MPPMNGRILFSLICAAAAVLLLIRMMWRKRAERRALMAPAPLPSNKAPVAPPSLAVSAAAPPPLPAAAQADEVAVPETHEYRPAARGAGRGAEAVSWNQRSLFSEGEPVAVDDRVPSLEPHEIPLHGQSDCVFGSATPMLASLLPESAARREELKKELRSAGYYQPHAWHNLAATRYVLLMGSILFFGIVLLLVPPRLEPWAIVAMIASGVMGWALPRLVVKGRATQRLSEIERGMPDMLDMLNMCVSQGMTVQESLGRISAQMKGSSPALAQELAIINEQAAMGSLDQALENFSDRIDLPEVHSFTSLVVQTDRMGTSVSDALAQYGDNMRENLRQRADEKANQAAFRLLFPTVMFLMPAVFIFLMGPAIVELSSFFSGGGRAALTRSRQSVDDVGPVRIRGN